MKKNFWKKAVAILTVTVLSCGSLAGCGGSKKQEVDNSVEDTKNLKIMLYAKGYGTEWLEKLAEGFEAKYEGVDVQINLANSAEVMKADLKNYQYCDTDLYFDIANNGGHGVYAENKQNYQNGQSLRDLTYLYDSEIPGEGITLGEKMNDSIKEACSLADSETYYFIPYVTAAMSLYYNETVINNALGEGNWTVPNTSDELIALCKQLKEKGCHFLLPGGLDQWASSYYLAWWSQYEGNENYKKFFEGIGYDATKNRETANSSLIFHQPGRLASAIASYEVLSYENGYTLPNSAEITVNNLNEYQTRFTLAKNNYAFYPCGDWLMQELENNSTIESDCVIKMMKTPVISSIIESTNSYSSDQAKRLPNITSDTILSQVIDYVDGNGKLPKGVTEEEVAIIKEARNTVGSKALDQVAYAPVFSNAKTLADNFLLYMASDEGIQILKEHCDGGFAPYDYEYDVSKLSVTECSVYEATKNAIYVDDFKYHELFYSAGVNSLTAGTADTLDGMFCKPNGLTGEEINQEMIEAFSGVKWDNYISKLSK